MPRRRAVAAPRASASSSSPSAITTCSASTGPDAPTSGTSSSGCAPSSTWTCGAAAPGASARPTSCAPRSAPSRTTVDQTIFIQQGGRNRHEHICESLELFASSVMPEFRAREAARTAAKERELAPYVAAALERKRAAAGLAEADIPTYEAYGLTVTELPDLDKMPE